MDCKLKFFYPQVKSVDVENRRITVCISKDEIDRHGERIEIIAIANALQGYAVNPVVLGDHQHRLSTGKSSVIGHTIPESFKALKDSVEMTIEFSITENAETYWINFRDGHQKAISIGFIDLEWRTEDVNGKKIFVSTKIELIEVSCVAVGANRGALIKAKDMFDREADMKPNAESKKLIVSEFTILARAISDLKSHIEDGLDEIKSLLIADSDRFAKDLLGGPSDPSGPAGEKQSEQEHKVVDGAITLFNKERN